MSSEIYKQTCDLLNGKNVTDRHSFFQLRYFLVGKEPTHQMRMWRCIRELNSRKESLEAMQNELLDLADKKELMEIEEARLNQKKANADALTTKELEVRLRRLNRKKQALEKSRRNISKKINEVEEESAFLITSFQGLEKKEGLKPFDDFQTQLEYWEAKISQEVQLRILSGLPLDSELIKTTLAMDDKSTIKTMMVKMLQENKKLIAENRKAINAPSK